ncbi:MAG: hypothetical protein K0R64_3092 [Novosphingobium lindaniclasticum]|nr:hypothetical protein [Novosphingobium lindaniclasticum]MDF2640108.1 hypothetical protein [Novosphingobium lindaniclasticum]
MESRGEEIHVEKTEARAGATPNVVRYVLLISLVLAIAAMSAIWIFGAVQAPDDTGGPADTRQAVERGDVDPQAQPGVQSPEPAQNQGASQN